MITTSTAQFLTDVERTPWLINWGKPLSLGAGERALSTEVCIQLLTSQDWADFRLMLKNRNARIVNIESYQRFERWNELAVFIGSQIEQRISPQIIKAIAATRIPSGSLSVFTWDILNVALEIEYRDLISVRPFTSMIWPIYRTGNSPCGWTGVPIDEEWVASQKPLPPGEIVYF